MIAGRLCLVVRGILLFVYDDEAEARKGGEDRGPRAQNQPWLAFADSPKRFPPSPVGKSGMQDGHPRAEASLEAARQKRCQADFGHQIQRSLPAGSNRFRSPQVDFRLTAPGDSFEKKRLKSAARQRGGYGGQGPIPGGRRFQSALYGRREGLAPGSSGSAPLQGHGSFLSHGANGIPRHPACLQQLLQSDRISGASKELQSPVLPWTEG